METGSDGASACPRELDRKQTFEPSEVLAGPHAQQTMHHLDAMFFLVRFDELALPPNDAASAVRGHLSLPAVFRYFR